MLWFRIFCDFMGTEDAIVLLYYTNMCVFELVCVASGVLSSILRVSRSTICRRMGQYGLSYSRNYCCVSDADLDDIVKRISMQHSGCGSKMMEGHLRAEGIVVQQVVYNTEQ